MWKMRRPAWALFLVACADAASVSPEVDVSTQALAGPCNETVPMERYIDGIPAYAQCDTTMNSAIFSNNGIDTSTTSMGSDWVRTQYSGGYQCTELAHRYLHFKWGVKWIPNGNAGEWCNTQPPASSGLVQTMVPVHGDLMVLEGGSCGAGAGTGHVNVVDTVDMAAGRLFAVEQNRAARGRYMITCAKCFLHVVANNGTPAPAAGAPATPPAAGSGAGPSAGAPAPTTPTTTTPPPPQTPPSRPMRAGAPAPVVPPQPTAAGAPAVVGAAGGPSVIQTGAAGSSAVIPLADPNAAPKTPAASARTQAPAEEGGCSVAGGPASSKDAGGAAFAVAFGLLLVVRRRRSRYQS